MDNSRDQKLDALNNAYDYHMNDLGPHDETKCSWCEDWDLKVEELWKQEGLLLRMIVVIGMWITNPIMMFKTRHEPAVRMFPK